MTQMIRKGLSITLSMLILATLLHLSVATHYCGGKETGMKISFTGKLAGCGMESSEEESPVLPGSYLKNHCCSDIITFCTTDSNWAPSFSLIPRCIPYDFLIFASHADLSVFINANPFLSFTNASPPGVLMSTGVDLSDICVFRI